MKWIQRIIPPILSIAIFMVMAILMSTIPSLRYEIDDYFWTQMIGSTLAILLTYLVWSPTGETKAKEDRRVKNNKAIYDARANYIVKNQMFSKLCEFCGIKNEELRVEIIKDKLSRVTVDYWIYELYVKKEKSEEEQHRLDAVMQTLTERQIKVIINLNEHGVSYKPLSPKDITMGRSSKHKIVNRNLEKMYKNSHIIMKSVWGIFTTCFTYFVVITPNDSFGWGQVVMITMWFFTFLMSIYSAIRVGYNSIAVYRDRYNQEQAELCGEFFEWTGTQLDGIDPVLKNENKQV